MTVHSPTAWSQQSRFLWTGRRDGKPIGTIEQGRRYAFTDLLGRLSRHQTLQAAQAAADD